METEEKQYKCELCDKSYSLNMSLMKHIINRHDGTTIKRCHLCSMKFQSEEKLQNHMKESHGSKLNCGYNYVKKHKCDICGKRYSSEKDLKLHTDVTHEGKKPFECNLCPKAFTAKDSLWYHFTIEHELKDQGINETNFHEHTDNPKVAEILRRKSKTPVKAVCKLCDKVLEGGKVAKANHIREHHTDENGNFKCPQCDLTFRKYELGWILLSLYESYR